MSTEEELDRADTEKELRSTLDKIAGWVRGQGQKQPQRSAAGGWVTGLVVAAIAMLVVGALYFRAWRQGRKLAKLLHEKDVAEQEVARKKAADRVKLNNEEAMKLEAEIEATEKDIAVLDSELNAASARKTRTDETIDALRNWRDVDRYLDGDSEPR
jgi:septal ring factor EnvC (AmiA/AmiB activator)